MRALELGHGQVGELVHAEGGERVLDGVAGGGDAVGDEVAEAHALLHAGGVRLGIRDLVLLPHGGGVGSGVVVVGGDDGREDGEDDELHHC